MNVLAAACLKEKDDLIFIIVFNVSVDGEFNVWSSPMHPPFASRAKTSVVACVINQYCV
jgi:hypothetical protein